MDVRTVVEVAGTSWCATVLGTTSEGSHGHPRFSLPFSSDAVPLLLLLLLPASLPLTAPATRTAQHLPMLRLRLRGLPLSPHLLRFLLTLLSLRLLLLLLLEHLLSLSQLLLLSLLLPLLALQPTPLLQPMPLMQVTAVVAAAAIATAVCVVVHSAAGAVGAADVFLRRGCADAVAAFEIDEQCVWYCSSIVRLSCYYFL